jgi:hypothetical protein
MVLLDTSEVVITERGQFRMCLLDFVVPDHNPTVSEAGKIDIVRNVLISSIAFPGT